MEKAAAAWGPLPRTRIRTYFKKMYARPIYRLLLVLLGLPTALMVLVKHLVFLLEQPLMIHLQLLLQLLHGIQCTIYKVLL